MKTYWTKPRQVEACQFTGTQASAAEIAEWIGSSVRGPLVEGALAGDYLTFNAGAGPQTAQKSDWIVKDADGFYHIIPEAGFEPNFSPLILQ